MRIKLFVGSDKEALEKEINLWFFKNHTVEVDDVKISCVEEKAWMKITIMVTYNK